jgi:hypothetical protein
MLRAFMTLLWISVAVGPIAADFNATHLFNPGWSPHARFHMMTVFSSAVALALFGLYLCWGPTASRHYSLKISALLGFLYTLSLLIATIGMPFYGGSLYWRDFSPRPPVISDPNLVVFLCVTAIFAILLFMLWDSNGKTPPEANP